MTAFTFTAVQALYRRRLTLTVRTPRELLIPLNTMFSGIGVIADRQQGTQRELLVAPISRASIVTGNMLAAVSITPLQVAVLVVCAELRGAAFVTGGRLAWFAASALAFSVLMYAVAELMANRLPSPEAYIGAARAWWHSPQYQAAAKLRRPPVSDSRAFLVDGINLTNQNSPQHQKPASP